jgi:hypothetical protein
MFFDRFLRRRSAPNHKPTKSRFRPSFDALELRDVPAVFDVGFGQAYTSIGAVPWNHLAAGDTVRIHWRSAAQGGDYHEKINISGQGTADQPISIVGVAGPNGELPVINGANATTGPDSSTAYLGHQARGLITLSRNSTAQDFNYYKPLYIVIDGLEVENANPQYSFTNSAGVVTQYAQNAAGIYIERGSNVTIRNVNIHNNGNGFFAGSNDYATNGGDGGMIRDVLFERNYVHDNGTPNGYSEHNIYTEGVNFTFQYNHLGPLLPTSLGANLKDRSAGTVIRYNWIESGGHLLDLVHAQESASITTKLPSYRQTFVYGNTLIDTPGPSGTMVHYGGDDPGATQDFRKGTLYFYDNTVIIQDNQFGPNAAYQTVVFQLATNDESADIRNNVFYRSAAVGAPAGTAPTLLAFAANGENAGQYHMGVNWVSPDWHAWYNDQPPAGGLFEGSENFISNAANDPGFVNLATYDLHPATGSALIDKGQAQAAATVGVQDVTMQYLKPQNGEARPGNGVALDLGAFEAAGAPVVSPGKIQFSASSYSVNESAGTITISATRTGGSSGAVSVSYSVTSGTATAGLDFTAVTGTLTWADGDTSSKTFTVPILDDSLVEGNETVTLTLSNPTGGATLGTPSNATLTIVDNDVPPSFGTLQFSTSAYSVNEAAGTATITVTRSGGSDGAVSVSYATSGGTAAAGQDYTAVSGTLTWAAGDTSSKTFTIPIMDDSLVEGNETIGLTLSNATGGATLGAATATLTIVDNDVLPAFGTIQFSASAYSVNEGAGIATITVTRSGGSDGAVAVTYATGGGTGAAGQDYAAVSGILTWAAGDTSSKTFTIPITDDSLVEGNETIGLTLSNVTGGATLGAATATLTIVDNDVATGNGQFQFSAAGYSVNENAGTVTITVVRTGGSAGAATVQYATYDMPNAVATAWALGDYRPVSGKLTFAAGETSKTFTVPIINDTLVEANETFGVMLKNPTGGTTLGPLKDAIVTIVEDDTAVEYRQPRFDVIEGQAFATIFVVREGNLARTTTVKYATTGETAYEGQDFVSTSGVLTFAPGETMKSFTVRILDDSIVEPVEQLALSLSSPTGAQLGANTWARLFITDNDVAPAQKTANSASLLAAIGFGDDQTHQKNRHGS